MGFFTCLRVRRQLTPYLGKALSPARESGVARHLRECAGCRREASRLEGLVALLGASLPAAPDPDWSDFWPGVRARIVTGDHAALREGWWWRLWHQPGWYPRLALGGGLAGLLLAATVLWQSGYQQLPALPLGVVVSALETPDPNGNVMVFSSPADEMTVVWVFGLDRAAD